MKLQANLVQLTFWVLNISTSLQKVLNIGKCITDIILYRHNSICSVAIMKQTLKIDHTIYKILQILSLPLLSKTHVNQLFDVNTNKILKK